MSPTRRMVHFGALLALSCSPTRAEQDVGVVGGGGEPSLGDPYGRGSIGSSSDPGAETITPPCEQFPCVEICWRTLALAPQAPTTGLVAKTLLAEGLWTQPAFGNSWVAVANFPTLEVRDPTSFEVLTSFPGLASGTLASFGDRVYAQGVGLRVFDLSEPSDARLEARWFDSEGELFQLVGTWDEGLILRSQTTLSGIRIGESGLPEEAFCLENRSEYSWITAEVTANRLVLSDNEDSTHAQIYALDSGQPVLISELEIASEAPTLLDGTRLVMIPEGGGLAVYELSGGEPEFIAVVEEGRYLKPELWGGFAMRYAENRGFETEPNPSFAYDVQGAMERYEVTVVPESPCLHRVESAVTGESFLVSPLLAERIPAEPVPDVQCPLSESFDLIANSATLNPAGDTLLIGEADGWLELALGSTEPPAPPIRPTLSVEAEAAFWLGDRLVTASTRGSDWGIEVRSELTVVETRDYSVLSELTSPGPILNIAAGSESVWAISLSKNFIYGEAQPKEHLLWRLKPAAEPSEIEIVRQPVATSIYRLEVAPERVYLIGREDIEVLDDTGKALQRVPLPRELPIHYASSRLGLLALGERGQLMRLATGSSEFLPIGSPCAPCRLIGADDTHLYLWAGSVEPTPHLSENELWVFDADGNRVARQPINSRGHLLLGNGQVLHLGNQGVVSYSLRPTTQ